MFHLKFKNLIYVISLSFVVVNLLVGATENKISDDPWIRTWFVAGPYFDYKEAKETSDSLSKVNHSDLVSFFQLERDKKALIVHSNSTSGKHSFFQHFLDTLNRNFNKNERFVIAFSTILSEKDTEVYYKHISHPVGDNISFFLNDKIIMENSNLKEMSKVLSLKKGRNTARIIAELKDVNISYWYDYHNSLSVGLFTESHYTKIAGKTLFKGKKIPGVDVEIYNESGYFETAKSDNNGNYEIYILNNIAGNNLVLYAAKNDLKHNKILERKRNGLMPVDIDLTDYSDKIDGKILTIHDDKKQSDILVQLLNIENEEVENKVFTDKSGYFQFDRLPFGSYQIFVETNQGRMFLRNDDGENKTIIIDSNQNNLSQINFKIPRINKGQWNQFNFINGLKSDMVFDVLIDSKKRIWYGCHTGLSVNDGNMIKNFGAREGMFVGAVIDVFEDSAENIWVLQRNNYTGFGRIFIINNDYSVTDFSQLYELESTTYNSIGEDSKGNIIIGGMNGLKIFDGKSFKYYKYSDGLGSGFITDVFVDGDIIWLGTSDGLLKYSGDNFIHLGANEGLKGSNYIRNISKSKQGGIIVTTGMEGFFTQENRSKYNKKSVYEYDGLIFKIKDEFNYTSNVSDIKNINDKVIYNSGNKVILKSNYFQQTISPYWSDEKPLGSNITSIDLTSSGTMIFGTIEGGAWKYNGNSAITISSIDGLKGNRYGSGVVDNEGNLWICSYNGGITVINENGMIVKELNEDNGFPTNSVRNMALDGFGNIWATSNKGLVNIVGEKYVIHDMDDGFFSNEMHGISINSNGLIWLSGFDFLSSFDGKIIKNYQSEIDSIRIFGGNAGLLALDDGSVLFGGAGLKRLIPNDRGGEFSFIARSGHCNAIDINKDGNILYSSVGEGLVKFNLETKEKDLHNIDRGFIYEVPLSAYIDNNGWIWSSSESGGVGLYNGSVWSFINTDDGLLSNFVSNISSNGENTYYFTHPNGVTIYNKMSTEGYVEINKVSTALNDFFTFEDVNSIVKERIQFSLSARNNDNINNKNKFLCSIDQNDKNIFTKVIDKPILEWYPSAAGAFKFTVQSIDQQLNYSKPRSIQISILNPWYLRKVFVIPFLGLIIFVSFVIFSSTKNYLKEKNFNEKLKLEGQKKDREARKILEQKNEALTASQKAAEAANEAKSTFLANMSHELRTPLNAIIGYSEMLIEDAEDENEDFIPDLDKINSSGKHLLGLINDILDLSKVESGKMELFIEKFNLEKVLNEVVSTIRPLVEKNKNTLKLSINTMVKDISADVTKIRQIMLNLLSNATKFTNEGEIRLDIDDNPENNLLLDFKVSDSGIGMTQEQIDKVFKPFTQADEKTTRKFGGTGLGLTITKMFSEMMGGKVTINSIINKGTTFTVTVPKLVVDNKVIEKKLKDGGNSNLNDSFSVLVIDDDPNAQELMKKFLIKENYNVLQATSGKDGLDLALKYQPDIITLDVMMPEMDGWEVLSSLQSNDNTKNIPVIMLTMANEPDIGYSLGATDYLTKPVDWAHLSRILEKHDIETKSQSILIVEDDEVTREMLKKSLETNNFKVVTAINGKDGLERVKKAKPALILLDLMMPEMDGFEFAQTLRENKKWLDIPVVVITAKDLSKEDHKKLKGNVEAIMQKGSYTRDELLNEVGQRIKILKEKD